MMNRGGGETATATAAAPSGDVTIPVAQVNDGKAHFYSYDAGGTTVKYFVLADKNGKVRAALDACEVCFAQKKGYHQEGDTMVCNNCGKVFPSDQINVITGGCNPIPLDKSDLRRPADHHSRQPHPGRPVLLIPDRTEV